MRWWLSSARSKRRETGRYPRAEAGFVQPPDASKKSIITGLSLYVLKTVSFTGSPPDIPPRSGQPPRRPIRR